jgi:hypothetical protein
MSLTDIVKNKSDTTMIRVSKDTRDLVDASKRQGESQSDCIKRIFQNCGTTGFPFGVSPIITKFVSGFSLEGFREYHYDRNQSHVFKNHPPDYVQMYEVYLVKDDENISVRGVSPNDLEKMKKSKNIIIKSTSGAPDFAFVSE